MSRVQPHGVATFHPIKRAGFGEAVRRFPASSRQKPAERTRGCNQAGENSAASQARRARTALHALTFHRLDQDAACAELDDTAADRAVSSFGAWSDLVRPLSTMNGNDHRIIPTAGS